MPDDLQLLKARFWGIGFGFGIIITYGLLYRTLPTEPVEPPLDKPIEPPKSGLPSVFDSFLQHDFWYYINTIGITVILAAFFIFTILYIIQYKTNLTIFRASVADIKDISIFFGMFYTSIIELAGRKGSRIFGLFLTIFVYLAILNLIGLLFVAVTAKSQPRKDFL